MSCTALRSSPAARSSRSRVTWRLQDSPTIALKTRWKWYGDTCACRASRRSDRSPSSRDWTCTSTRKTRCRWSARVRSRTANGRSPGLPWLDDTRARVARSPLATIGRSCEVGRSRLAALHRRPGAGPGEFAATAGSSNLHRRQHMVDQPGRRVRHQPTATPGRPCRSGRSCTRASPCRGSRSRGTATSAVARRGTAPSPPVAAAAACSVPCRPTRCQRPAHAGGCTASAPTRSFPWQKPAPPPTLVRLHHQP